MIEEKELDGYWWKPNDQENYVGGKVVYTPENGVILNTFSSFGEGMRAITLEASDFDRLYGITTEGDPVTLDDCRVVSSSYRGKRGGGAATLEMKWQYLLIGHHFDGDILFDRARVTYPLVDQWSQISGVSYEGSFINGPSSSVSSDEESGEPPVVSAGDTFNIEYTFPESRSADVGDFELKLLVNANFSIGSPSGASIEEKYYFDIIPHKNEIGLETAIEKSGVLKDFLTLGIGRELRISKLIGRMEVPNGYTDVGIYFNTSDDFDVPESVHPESIIFTLEDVDEEFETVLQRWFEKYSELEDTFNLYFSSIYNRDMYLNVQLLTLMQALEAYHRISGGDKYLTEEEYNEFYETIVDRLPEGLPADFRSHLVEGTLKYANEYSLRKRLFDIIDQHNSLFQNMDLVSEDVIFDIVNTRNYLTHYAENIEAVSQNEEMWNQIQVLRIIAESVLLSEIGLTENQIIRKIEDKYQARMIET